MFSVNNTVVDVKERLENAYTYYSFATDEDFEAVLENISEDVMRIYFYPRIGITEYNRIAAKDKIDLTASEEYLYWAEIYGVCYEFLKFRGTVSGQLQTSGVNESLTVEGYSYKTGTNTGSSLNDASLSGYRDKMFQFFKLAGFNLMALQRTCHIFGDSYDEEELLNIIE
jgi:hypothetical protein